MNIYSIFRKIISLDGPYLHWILFTPNEDGTPALVYDQLVSCEGEAALILTRIEGNKWQDSSLYIPIPEDKEIHFIHLGSFDDYVDYFKEIDRVCKESKNLKPAL